MATQGEAFGDLQVVVGYDGAPPAERALDAAVRLLRGRDGRITVAFVAHPPSATMLSAAAVVDVEAGFDTMEEDLRASVDKRLHGVEERWGFQRRRGVVADELIAVARELDTSRPGSFVVIVVGSSSHAMHRVVGSVAVNLARRAPYPVVVVP